MDYRPLGRSGVMVSELCFGCMTVGRELDESDSVQMIERFVDAGGNFLDTANVYSQGVSEEITGRAAKHMRDDLVIATKVRFGMGDGPNDAGLSRKHIQASCEASLKRLSTDYIDLYQVHCWDEVTPIEETLSALTDLVRAGKVRYLGISNFAGHHIEHSMWVSATSGYEPFISLQPQYSLVERHIEYEVLPAARRHGLGVIPWGPLGGGFMSGKYKRGERPPEDARIASATDDMEESWEKRAVDRNWAIIDVVGQISEQTGKTYAQIALNWLLCQDAVAAPIIGATKMSQLEDNLGAVGWRLETEQVERLNEISKPPVLYPYGFIADDSRMK